MKPDNPFVIQTYFEPAYFCDRKLETAAIIESIKAGQDITLFALRRMGKTGLIFHSAHLIEKQLGYVFLFTDLFDTSNLNQMVNRMSESLAIGFKHETSWLKKFTAIFRSVRPVLTFDPITGDPSISLDIQSQQQAWTALEDIFQFLQKSKKKIVWALDEFQQIATYPADEGTEGKLRSLIQRSKNARFIFSGSKKHMLLSMFSDGNRPFYQSTRHIYLKEIERKEYISFIYKFMKQKKLCQSPEQLEHIIDVAMGHTAYVQQLCNRIYAIGNEISEKNTLEILRNLESEQSHYYYNYRSMLSAYQWRLLEAVALEEKLYAPNAGAFIAKYKLNSSPAVNRALASLTDAGLVDHIDEGVKRYYRLNDVFLIRWFQDKRFL